MFVHRETWAGSVSEKIEELGIVGYKESVRTAVKDLLDGGLLKEVREEHKMKIRTANLKLFEQSLRAVKLSGKQYQKFLVGIAPTMERFPEFYFGIKIHEKSDIKRIPWNTEEGNFARYLMFINHLYNLHVVRRAEYNVQIGSAGLDLIRILEEALKKVNVDDIIKDESDLSILAEIHEKINSVVLYGKYVQKSEDAFKAHIETFGVDSTKAREMMDKILGRYKKPNS